ncbi:LysM peptidoglycan-binding domain-containing protein [Thiovibrio sp. JS02]
MLLAALLFAAVGCAPLAPPPDTFSTDHSSPPIAWNDPSPPKLSAPEPFVVPETTRLNPWQGQLPGPAEAETESLYDFPVTMNEQVEYYLDFFQNRQHDAFGGWLSRAGRYLPMVKKQLAEAGLPQDLAYLPLIESGYNLRAYSSAAAVGPWQFMRATGRGYGLTVNKYVDERRDPIKSTQAAVAYLSNLYEEFDSWHLAVAAYNAGEGRIRRAIREEDSTDFWEIASGRYLHSETKDYVPKLIAAIMIAKDPEKYGFTDIEYEEPLDFETVHVPRWTSLKAVAVACGTDFDEIYDLNRQLCKAITPPDVARYPLRVPLGKKELVQKNLPRVREVASIDYRDHVVGKGETITRICKKYNLKKTTLLKANNLRHERLTLGQHLRIPFQTTTFQLLSEEQLAKAETARQPAKEDLVLHTVKNGETIGSIAKRYAVPAHLIATWNKLKDPGRIKVGQELALYIRGGAPQKTSQAAPRPQSGKSAKKSRSDEKSASAAKQPKAAKGKKATTYLVKLGDTLWSIAQKYQLSPQDIKSWNQLENDRIQPGSRLLLNLPQDMDT